MIENKYDSVDAALEALPRDVAPDRDLWPAIRSEIRGGYRSAHFGLWGQLAAAAVLVLVTAATTYFVTRQSVRTDIAAAIPAARDVRLVTILDAGLDDAALGANYMRARADLDRLFAERIASLPPASRAKLQSNLADLRRAADEIAATLAEHPSDSLLQELLRSTQRRELALLADVGRMSIPNT